MPIKHHLCHIASITVVLLQAGCAALPQDLGRADVDLLVSERGRPVIDAEGGVATASLLKTWMSEPLTADRAMRIALLNNPGLKKSYASLGFAAADVYAAGRIRNPIFSATMLDSNRPGVRDQVTLGLVTSFTDILTLSARKRLAAGQFAVTKQMIGAEVLVVAAQAETNFYQAVGAKQFAALRGQIATAGELSAALAERFYDAGNMKPRELALERAAAADLRMAALEAEAEAIAKRIELATVLGLSTGGSWEIPTRLPAPLQREDDLESLLRLARQSRLDLSAAMQDAEIVADRLGVTNWTRLLGDLHIGAERERETDGVKLRGPTLEWDLPVFTQNRDFWLRVDTELRIAIAEVERLRLEVDNDTRLAFASIEYTKKRIRNYRESLIPARIEAVARAQEEVNYMLIGIFELLVIKQQEYDAYVGYLGAVQDYWLARSELTLAVGNTLPGSGQAGTDFLDVEQFLSPQTGGMDHSAHGGMQDHSMMAPGSQQGGTAMDHTKHNMDATQKPASKAGPHQKHQDQESTNDDSDGEKP